MTYSRKMVNIVTRAIHNVFCAWFLEIWIYAQQMKQTHVPYKYLKHSSYTLDTQQLDLVNPGHTFNVKLRDWLLWELSVVHANAPGCLFFSIQCLCFWYYSKTFILLKGVLYWVSPLVICAFLDTGTYWTLHYTHNSPYAMLSLFKYVTVAQEI